jgi:hypothetical protein
MAMRTSQSKPPTRLSAADLPTDVQALQQSLLQADTQLQIQEQALQANVLALAQVQSEALNWRTLAQKFKLQIIGEARSRDCVHVRSQSGAS